MTRVRHTAADPLTAAALRLLEASNRLHAVLVDMDAETTSLGKLRAIHRSADLVGEVRSAFADLKGLAAVRANQEGNSYPEIARALDCSEPYVQQMIYRGRKVRR